MGGADLGDDLETEVLSMVVFVDGLLGGLEAAGLDWDLVTAGLPCPDFAEATGLGFPWLAGLVLAGLILLLVATCEEVSF